MVEKVSIRQESLKDSQVVARNVAILLWIASFPSVVPHPVHGVDLGTQLEEDRARGPATLPLLGKVSRREVVVARHLEVICDVLHP